MGKPRPLPYHGGKQRYGKAKWINSLLPQDTKVYIEPCGGMFAVGCQRQPATLDVYNDLDGDVVNWWEQMRSHPDEFWHRVYHTPRSRAVFDEAKQYITSPDKHDDPMRWAIAYHVALDQSVGALKGNWLISTRGAKPWAEERVRDLADRMRYVYIENVDAVELIRRYAKREDTCYYIDPPYSGTRTDPYKHAIDPDEMTDALHSIQGFASISGYPGEWDHLGWQLHTRGAIVQMSHMGGYSPRTECLWVNR